MKAFFEKFIEILIIYIDKDKIFWDQIFFLASNIHVWMENMSTGLAGPVLRIRIILIRIQHLKKIRYGSGSRQKRYGSGSRQKRFQNQENLKNLIKKHSFSYSHCLFILLFITFL